MIESTGFALDPPDADLPVTPEPTAEDVRILRDDVDPTGARLREFR